METHPIIIAGYVHRIFRTQFRIAPGQRLCLDCSQHRKDHQRTSHVHYVSSGLHVGWISNAKPDHHQGDIYNEILICRCVYFQSLLVPNSIPMLTPIPIPITIQSRS